MIGDVIAAIILRSRVGVSTSAVAMSALHRLARVSKVWKHARLTALDIPQKPSHGRLYQKTGTLFVYNTK